MDREVKEHYQVVIQAKDMAGQMGGLSGTTTVSITLSDVNDNPPRFNKSEYRTGTRTTLICRVTSTMNYKIVQDKASVHNIHNITINGNILSATSTCQLTHKLSYCRREIYDKIQTFQDSWDL